MPDGHFQEEETGKMVAVWLSRTVLKDLFETHSPMVRDTIGLKYLGKDTKKGYHRYHLMVEREEDRDSANVPL